MKVIWFALLIIILFQGCDSTSSIEDPNDSYFVKFFGGEGDQEGVDLVVLPDGSTILFGTTQPTGGLKQWYLVRADPRGQQVWEKQFGDPALIEEVGAIELTTDNRLIAVGNYYKTPTDRDIRVMTISLDGAPLDSAFINIRDVNGNPTTADEVALSVTQTNDGFVIAGSTTYLFPKGILGETGRDALKVRLFDDLNVYPNAWLQTYGYTSDEVSQKIFQLPNGLFYVFGYTNRNFSGFTNNYNFWVFSLSSTGDFSSQELTPPPGSPTDNDRLTSVVPVATPSGNEYFMSGITVNGTGASDVYVTKLGTPLSFGPTDYLFQKALSLRLGTTVSENTSTVTTFVGGSPVYYILANENSLNNNQNWVLTKLSFDGSVSWALPIVFGGEGLDTCGRIQLLPDGRILLIGTMITGKPDVGEKKMTLIKVNQEGKFLK